MNGNWLKNISRKLLEIFDFNLKSINQIIQSEIANGAKFEQLVFPIPELKHIHVIQFFKNHEEHGMVAGLGADPVLEMAYLKAIVEYFERLGYAKNIKSHDLYSTNGIAAHRIGKIAKNSARDELLERDSFLRHWYTNSSFVPVALNTEENTLNDILKKRDLEIFLGKTYLGFSESTLCFLKNRKTGCFALGLSAGRPKNSEKAIQEALINHFFGDLGVSAEEQLKVIDKNGVATLAAHRALWLYREPMPAWIFDETSRRLDSVDRALAGDFKYELLESEPFKVYSCKNAELLDLYVGDVCKINPTALTKMGINVVLGPTVYHPIP